MLKWTKVDNITLMSECMADGVFLVFSVYGPGPKGYYSEGEYYIKITVDGTLRFDMGMGKLEERAKHAAENFLKLVLSGRNHKDISTWELEVGWEFYKRLSTPDFIPVVVDGRLVRKE